MAKRQLIADENQSTSNGGFEVELGAISTLGAGIITWTYTVTRSDTGLPIDGVDVWITSDISGNNILCSGTTNQSGVVTFYLDPGTVYVWCQKSGFNFSNPDTEVVS